MGVQLAVAAVAEQGSDTRQRFPQLRVPPHETRSSVIVFVSGGRAPAGSSTTTSLTLCHLFASPSLLLPGRSAVGTRVTGPQAWQVVQSLATACCLSSWSATCWQCSCSTWRSSWASHLAGTLHKPAGTHTPGAQQLVPVVERRASGWGSVMVPWLFMGSVHCACKGGGM